jgi:hypothetical protein
MNCYVCDMGGRVAEAVAVCQSCGAALCRTHLDDELVARRPAGLHRVGCTHGLQVTARGRRPSAELPSASVFTARTAAR